MLVLDHPCRYHRCGADVECGCEVGAMSIADEVEAVALGPAPTSMFGAYVGAIIGVANWTGNNSEATTAVLDALEGNPFQEITDWRGFIYADEALQRMFLLSVAESLR
jgi:hypothetical protein